MLVVQSLLQLARQLPTLCANLHLTAQKKCCTALQALLVVIVTVLSVCRFWSPLHS